MKLEQGGAEAASAGLSLSLLLSYPPCQQFKREMANSVPDKKGRIAFSDAATSSQGWYTLAESP